MRLCKFDERGEITLTENLKEEEIPSYAILSHTWGAESDEVTLKDIEGKSGDAKSGYAKLQFCGKQARTDDLQHFWVDTCCIDKSNRAEMSDAINLMFSWYRKATKCYVYLSDVSSDDKNPKRTSQSTWESDFRTSRWFTRGWTLQELIAPASLEFFSMEGTRIGSKKSLERQIHEITGISVLALQGSPLSGFDVEERKSWASKRSTTRREDEAYCLLGIFEVQMPFIYGEGEKAMNRLQDEIDKSLRDQRDRRYIAEERKCHESLCTSEYEKFMARNPSRVHRTCQWFLQHYKFLNWRASETSSLLWLSADPGTGKSVLSRFLVENELVNSGSRSVCYFFFKDDNVKQKSASNAMSAVLHQLFSQNARLIKHAMADFRREPENLPNLFIRLWSVLISAAGDSEAGEVICVLDGLDECEESGRFELIDRLSGFYRSIASDNTSTTKLKFLVTSRPYFDIERRFSHLARQVPTIRLMGESESETISAEIDFVIKARIHHIDPELGLDDSEKLSLESALLGVDHRTYLWLELIFEVVRCRLESMKLRQIIETLPDTVEKVYEAILEGSIDMELTRKLLCIVVSALRPLTVKEMSTALDMEGFKGPYEQSDQESETDFKATVRKLCGRFVSIIDNKIYLVHQTAKDFLITNGDVVGPCPWKYTLEPTQSNLVLAEVCISYLMLNEFECSPLVIDDEASKNDLEASVGQYLTRHDFLDYAAKHWSTHYRVAQPRVDATLLDTYFKVCDTRSQRFMSWFQIYWNSQIRCPQSVNPLILSAYFGHQTAVRRLLECDANLEPKDSNFHGQTPLSLAAEQGHDAVVDLLLARGANPDSRSDVGRTPLSYAAAGGHESVVKLLLSNGAKLDSADDSNRTCLRWAARYGHEGIVRLLLDRGADFDCKEDNGETPLSWAAANGCDAVVKLLLERGGEVNPPLASGRTPLFLAADGGHETAIHLLLDRGAELESRETVSGQTPLSRAARKGQEAAVKILLEKGANPNAEDNDGGTPLSWASRNSHDPVLRLLLTHPHIKLDCRDNRGRTPLWWAAQRGNVGALGQLLSLECVNLDLKDDFGWTPLSCAAREGYHDVVELLLEQYKIKGIAVTTSHEDAEFTSPPASDIKGHIFCDICSFNVPDDVVHYHCGLCSNGDFDLCQACIDRQEYCSDRSHKFVKRMYEDGRYVAVPD